MKSKSFFIFFYFVVLILSSPIFLFTAFAQEQSSAVTEENTEQEPKAFRDHLSAGLNITHGFHLFKSERYLKVPIDSALMEINNEFILFEKNHIELIGGKSLSHTAAAAKSQDRRAEISEILTRYQSHNDIWSLRANLVRDFFSGESLRLSGGLAYQIQNFRHDFGSFTREYSDMDNPNTNNNNKDSWLKIRYLSPLALLRSSYQFNQTLALSLSLWASPYVSAKQSEQNIIRKENGNGSYKGNTFGGQMELRGNFSKSLGFNVAYELDQMNLKGTRNQVKRISGNTQNFLYEEKIKNIQHHFILGLAYIF
jgi:hypothetical protein